MGIRGRQDGASARAGNRRTLRQAFAGRRKGYSNGALLAAMAVLLCIALLSQITSGELNLSALVLKSGTTVSKDSKSKKTKAPPMIPGEPRPVATLDTPGPALQIPAGPDSATELRQAIAQMDSLAAAQLLAELDTPTIVELLIEQRERDLARILEEADPIYAALWVAALLAESERRRLIVEQAIPAQPVEPPVAGDGAAAPAGTEEPAPIIEQPPPVDGASGAAADVPAENGSSGTGTALPLPPGTNIA